MSNNIEYNQDTFLKVKLTKSKIKMEISIRDLIFLFENYENNVAEDGESPEAKVIRNKKIEFTKHVIERLLDEADQDTGCPYWGIALNEVFDTLLEESLDDCLKYKKEIY